MVSFSNGRHEGANLSSRVIVVGSLKVCAKERWITNWMIFKLLRIWDGNLVCWERKNEFKHQKKGLEKDLIYIGSVTPDLHPLPWPTKSRISPISTKPWEQTTFTNIIRWATQLKPLQIQVFPTLATQQELLQKNM